MDSNENRLRDDLAQAQDKCAEEWKSLHQIKKLLAKADERRVKEPEEPRKWNRVLENLERSLDRTRIRYQQSELQVRMIERELSEAGYAVQAAVLPSEGTGAVAPGSEEAADSWSDTIRRVGALNLEEASQLQSKIDSGEIQDEQLEAGLALANQLQTQEEEGDPDQPRPRRQLVLRAAIDKIGKQQFDQMSLDEINLVMACHSLLTSRLEPTPRDQRLRRILDGAVKILQRKKDAMGSK